MIIISSLPIASRHSRCFIVLATSLLLFHLSTFAAAKPKDYYTVLGVDKNASQQEIKKAFHRESLKYHPDKNPSKEAKAKFLELSEAYDILSDKEKRKKYDLYGDEQGYGVGPEQQGPGSAYSQGPANSQGWSHFSFEKNGRRKQSFQGGFGSDEDFSFPFTSGFGGQERSFSFDFGGESSFMGNIFENIFGSRKSSYDSNHFSSEGMGKQTGRSGFEDSKSEYQNVSIEQLSSRDFKAKVLDQPYAWAVLFYASPSPEMNEKVSILKKVASALYGSFKVGLVDCQMYESLCKSQKMWPLKSARLHLFSLKSDGKLGSVEYTGKWVDKFLKDYCVEVLPKFSTHTSNLHDVGTGQKYPQAVLFTKRQSAPAIWRALSGLFYNRVLFYDVQVDDLSDPTVKRFKVQSLPSIVGIYPNGEHRMLSIGDDLEPHNLSLQKLQKIISSFEKSSAPAGAGKAKSQSEGEFPLLSKGNLEEVCSMNTPVCFIAAFKSSTGKEKAKEILRSVAKKTFVRKGRSLNSVKNPISFCLLDAYEQSAFLQALGKFKSNKDAFMIAYKRGKGKYALHEGAFTFEGIEKFIVEVLSGDVPLKKVQKDPKLVQHCKTKHCTE